MNIMLRYTIVKVSTFFFFSLFEKLLVDKFAVSTSLTTPRRSILNIFFSSSRIMKLREKCLIYKNGETSTN